MSSANWSRATCKHLYEVNGTIQQCYFTDDDLLHAIYSYIEPKPHEWVFTALYVIVFVLGLTGNFLVCYAVWKNRQLRTSTNLFLVNLAVADFLVITLCLPPSYIQSIWETWFLGDAMCRIVEYYQVDISLITLFYVLTGVSLMHPNMFTFRNVYGFTIGVSDHFHEAYKLPLAHLTKSQVNF